MLEKGAVLEVQPELDSYVSTLFIVQKKDGGSRPVINLKNLNAYLPYEHFKMEGIHLLKDLLIRDDWLAKIDLKDAYFTVPINAEHQRYLRFVWNNRTFQFSCLPFGLAPAPRVFTKILKPLVSILRQRGVRLIIYLDDCLVMNQSVDGLSKDIALFLELIQGLGFVVNTKKSCLTPVQKLEFLGFIIDPILMELQLPRDKIKSIRRECLTVLQSDKVTVRDLSRVLGKLTASIQAVFPAPLHYRHIQADKHKALAQCRHYEAVVTLSPQAKEELRWWTAHLDAWNGKAVLLPQPDLVIETDASTKGWGAVCQGVRSGGPWSPSEKFLHINCLELLAGAFAIQSYTTSRAVIHVRLKMDNRSALTYINNLGGTHSLVLSNLAKDMWHWALQKGMMLSAEHLPGRLNQVADYESRHFSDASDWKLHTEIFSLLKSLSGPLQIDLFANRLNHQLPRYYSWRPDPLAEAVDALQQSWSVGPLYAFPPFCLIAKSLAKIREDIADVLIITPVWPAQPWYPLLLSMSVDPPVLLPPLPDLILAPDGQPHPLVENLSMNLAAWHVSGETWRQEAYHNQLQTSCLPHGAKALMQTITRPGVSGKAGVWRGKLILFKPLWQV
jgi:hypothetical protein